MSKISIIVPIYNVEKYLKECVESILTQSFKNFELILVDDGSPDNSGKMCDEFALTDNRIRVIHKENGGLSSARNAGLDIIKGEYVCFVDSDDFIHKNMLKILNRLLTENNCEIAVGKFKKFKDNDIIDFDNESESFMQTINSEKLIELAITDNEVTFSVCNKIFKSSLWDGIRFREKTYYEDEDLTYKIFDRAKNCVLCDKQLYYYRINNQGITNTLSPKIIDQYYTRKGMYEYIRDKYPNLANLCYAYWAVISLLIYYQYKYAIKMDMKQYLYLNKFDKKILRKAYKYKLSRKFYLILLLYMSLPFSIIDFIFWIRSIIHKRRKVKNNAI